MENVSMNVLDELGRILLPKKLRGQVGWEIADNLTATIDIAGRTLILRKQQGGELSIDDLGRTILPKALVVDLGWCAGDKFSLTLNTDAGTITISFAQKRACVFCENSEVVYTLNGVSVCKSCVGLIKDSGL